MLDLMPGEIVLVKVPGLTSRILHVSIFKWHGTGANFTRVTISHNDDCLCYHPILLETTQT